MRNTHVNDLQNGIVQEIMEALRLKFSITRAALGVKLEYDGYPKPKASFVCNNLHDNA